MVDQYDENDLIQKEKSNYSINSRIKFLKRDNCRYQVQLLDNTKKIKELYEVKVGELLYF